MSKRQSFTMDTRPLTLLGVLLLCCFTHKSADALRTYYMNELCSYPSVASTIRLGSPSSGSFYSSGVLRATTFLRYSSGKNCSVTLDAGVNRIIASLRNVDLRAGCTDTLTLSEGRYGKKTMYCTDYSDFHESRTFESGSTLIVNFTTSLSSLTTYSGFQLVFTAYTYAPCSSYEYRCNNLRCIAEDLKCDGHNHCGDRSDQNYCGMSAGGIVGTILGVIFLGVAVVAGIVYCCGRKKRIIRTTYESLPQPQTNAYPTQPAATHPPPYQENYPPLYQGNYQPPYQGNINPVPVHMGNPIKAGVPQY